MIAHCEVAHFPSEHDVVAHRTGFVQNVHAPTTVQHATRGGSSDPYLLRDLIEDWASARRNKMGDDVRIGFRYHGDVWRLIEIGSTKVLLKETGFGHRGKSIQFLSV